MNRARVRGTPGSGHGGAGCKTGAGQPGDHVGEQGLFAAEQVRRAAGVDHQAGGRVGRHDRRVKLQGPERQAVQGFGVTLGVRVVDDQLGAQGAGLGRRHAGIEP
jgi:hypothetical protein